ncbi:MAG: hypothetical protein KBG20_03300 [Caldilineaceae bacterium]|nr:hypothetical protein [Caldilineaceae bacterium]MBP8108989.1 hypothetical protein [Caldilineaceae bacterium]MBP8124134.1 hypothetical protein [Caldilineaceae bacterium]MBP9071293.1 hypothetical protein [Caldilineaceae bacterium]
MRPFNFSSLALSPQRPFLRRIHHLFLLGLLTTALLLGGSLGTFALPAAQSQAHCENLDYLLINPSFETQTGWELVSADYSTVRAYLSTQSMRLGIVDTDNVPSISYIQVTMDLPSLALSPTTDLTLSMRYWSIISGGDVGNDLQYVDVYNAYNNQFLKRIWFSKTSTPILDMNGDGKNDEIDAKIQDWPLMRESLNDIKGMTNRIRIFFAVTNDGGGGTTALFLDDLTLRACDDQPTATPTRTLTSTSSPTATRTPSVTPTATTSPSPTASGTATPVTPTPVLTATQTPTPVPTGENCQPVPNGGFESNSDWFFGQDPYPASYDTGEHFSGTRSVRLGVPSNANTINVPTYSSVRQLISIPSTAVTANLNYRLKFRTDQAPDENPSNVNDRQELILLNGDLSTLAIVERRLRNTNSWEPPQEHSLLDYRGFPPFYIYFNVYNDGNGARTWAYLDDVSLCVTYAATATATITPIPAATPTATSTAAPTTTSTSTPTSTLTATSTSTPIATATAETAVDMLATAVGVADTASDLINQAKDVATLAVGTPTLDPNVERVGDEKIGGNRPVTPIGQTPISMIPVADRTGLTFGNLIGGAIFIIFVIAVVAALFARNRGPKHP